MYHRTRRTPNQIGQLLDLITPLVYMRKKSLPSFRLRERESALTPSPIEVVVGEFSANIRIEERLS